MDKFLYIFSWQKSRRASALPQPVIPDSEAKNPTPDAIVEEHVQFIYQRRRKAVLQEMFGAGGR